MAGLIKTGGDFRRGRRWGCRNRRGGRKLRRLLKVSEDQERGRQEAEQEVQRRAVRERATDEDGSTVRGTCSRLERLLPPALINFTTETDCDNSPPKQETHCVLHPNNPCTPAWPARRADHKSRPGCTKIISFPHLISWTPFSFRGRFELPHTLTQQITAFHNTFKKLSGLVDGITNAAHRLPFKNHSKKT